MSLTARFVLLHAHRVTRRAAHLRRRRLMGEMEAFRTPREVHDLLATLDRYPDGATCEYRNILADQLDRRQARATSGRWRAMGQY
jgi:hypothetical protein